MYNEKNLEPPKLTLGRLTAVGTTELGVLQATPKAGALPVNKTAQTRPLPPSSLR